MKEFNLQPIGHLVITTCHTIPPELVVDIVDSVSSFACIGTFIGVIA
jgi:hypothetical protein